MKRLELERDLQAEVLGIVPQGPDVLDADRPLIGRRDHLALPDVLAEHEQDVLRLEEVGQVEIGAHPVDVEPLHARVEVDQADGHAGDADDRQARPVAFVLDELPLSHVDVERVGEDVDRVEADLLRLLDSVRRLAARLGPGGIDQAEFHGSDPIGRVRGTHRSCFTRSSLLRASPRDARGRF